MEDINSIIEGLRDVIVSKKSKELSDLLQVIEKNPHPILLNYVFGHLSDSYHLRIEPKIALNSIWIPYRPDSKWQICVVYKISADGGSVFWKDQVEKPILLSPRHYVSVREKFLKIFYPKIS